MADSETLAGELAATVADLDRRLRTARVVAKAAMQYTTKLATERHEAVEHWFEDVTRDEILADPELRTVLCGEAFSQTWAHERIEQLSDFAPWADDAHHLSIGGIDARDEYAELCLPNLQVALHKGLTVSQLAGQVRNWVRVWALGRPEVYVSVLTTGESIPSGVWGLWVEDTASDLSVAAEQTDGGRARVEFLTYGHTEPKFHGPVDACLAFLCQRAWYSTGGATDHG